MNNRLIRCTAAFAIAFSAFTFSSVHAAEGGIRIAVIRIQEAFNDYQKTKEMRKSIETSFKQQRDGVEKLGKSIETMKNDLRRESTRLTPGSYKMFERIQAIKAKEFLHKTMRDTYRKDLNEEMVVFYKAIYEDFQKAVADYSAQPGVKIDLVIRAADQDLKNKDAFGIQNEIGLKILHYYRPALDITQQVIQVMNRNYQKSRKGGR